MLCVVNEILNYLILNYGLHCDNFFYYCPAVFYKARHLSLSKRYTELKCQNTDSIPKHVSKLESDWSIISGLFYFYFKK